MSIIKKGDISKISICHFTWTCKSCGHQILEEPNELSMHYSETKDSETKDDIKKEIKCPKCNDGLMQFFDEANEANEADEAKK